MEDKNSYRSLAIPPLPGYNTKAPVSKTCNFKTKFMFNINKIKK